MLQNIFSYSPRDVAETTARAIWQYNEYDGCYIQDNEVRTSPVLSLCTNQLGYSVVAEFIVQEESAEKIAEALGVIKQWNPSWNPSFFMTDYSEAELLAIEQVFPSAKSFICDFHREQA